MGKLLVDKKNSALIVDGRYFEACSQIKFTEVLLLKEKILSSELKERGIKTLGFCQESTTYQSFLELDKMAKEIDVKLIPKENPLKWMRAVKAKEEIELLEKAAILGSEGFKFILSSLKEGVTERKMAIELDIFWKRKGGDLAFEPIIAFGANSSMPHYRSQKVALKKGDTVLIDIGVTLDHYHSDMTRTLFFGEPHPKMKEIYKIVKRAQEPALNYCKEGVTIADLDKSCRKIIEEAGFGEEFSHGLGDGIGLEVHEAPAISKKLPIRTCNLKRAWPSPSSPASTFLTSEVFASKTPLLLKKEGSHNLTSIQKDLTII